MQAPQVGAPEDGPRSGNYGNPAATFDSVRCGRMKDKPSDVVKCDATGCKSYGRRREGYMVPEHWFYIESVVAHSVKRRVHVVYACSNLCRDSMWKQGPGPKVVDESGTVRMRAEEDRNE